MCVSREGPQTAPSSKRGVSSADLRVSHMASSPFMSLSCDRPHDECLEAALYHGYYFLRAAGSAKWWPDARTDFPNEQSAAADAWGSHVCTPCFTTAETPAGST